MWKLQIPLSQSDEAEPILFFICPSGSWVELEGLVSSAGSSEAQDTTASILQGELERILLEAQLECERSSQTERCGAEGLLFY